MRIKYRMDLEGNKFVIPHFRVREFRQVDLDWVRLDDVALMALNNFRQGFGIPIHITSGFRVEPHNAEVGGAPNSLHLLGAAFDLDLGDTDRRLNIRMLKAAGFTEVIYYPKTKHYHAGVEHGT